MLRLLDPQNYGVPLIDQGLNLQFFYLKKTFQMILVNPNPDNLELKKLQANLVVLEIQATKSPKNQLFCFHQDLNQETSTYGGF